MMGGVCVAQVDPEVWLMGVDCNVSSPGNVHRLADAARSALGTVDVWINNAGYSGSFQVTGAQLQSVSTLSLSFSRHLRPRSTLSSFCVCMNKRGQRSAPRRKSA